MNPDNRTPAEVRAAVKTAYKAASAESTALLAKCYNIPTHKLDELMLCREPLIWFNGYTWQVGCWINQTKINIHSDDFSFTEADNTRRKEFLAKRKIKSL